MKRLLPLLLAFFFLGLTAWAQLGTFANMPIDIRGDHTDFKGGLAVAEGNVFIRYGESTIYCDYAQYNSETHDVLLLGNVRIYRSGRLFTSDRAVYNLETKKLTAADVKGDVYPYQIAAQTLTSIGPNAYQVHDGLFTTSDNSKPDYHMSARSARIYPGDRIVLNNVTFYVGKTPVFWFPAVYQSLNKDQGLLVVPGYTSVFGAYLKSRYSFPITPDIGATFEFDLLSKRGVGLGIDSRWGGGDTKEEKEWGRFRSYYIHDLKPELNETSLAREPIKPDRYRVSLQDRTYLTEDIYSSININKLSDARFLQDFYPGEFRSDPNPDNLVALTKWDEDYTITLSARRSLNQFFDFTERLPELAFDSKERPIFGNSGLFYVGETSAGYYKRDFATGATFSDYQTFRADSFHQIEFPKTLFGFLSVVPKVGIRGTYYQRSGHFEEALQGVTTITDLNGVPTGEVGSYSPELFKNGSVFRGTFNAGIESSFKISRAYEQVQSRLWGLDGLRHVIQPYTDLSYVWTSKNASDLLQFDRINPSTQRTPIDFPEFGAVDSIQNWDILRLGVNNRFQTRRDNQTINWLELNTFVDINFQRPNFEDPGNIVYGSASLTQMAAQNAVNKNGSLPNRVPIKTLVADPGTFSNLYNRLSWQPYNWVRLNVDSQLPVFDAGFTEVNSNVNFLVNQDTSIQVGHEYIQGNPFFTDSSYIVLGGYRRITDNWGVSFRDAYEFQTSQLALQRYAIHRDLSSWVASLALDVVNNGAGKVTYGVALTFTLKDLPQISLPVSFDPSQIAGGGSSKNP